MSAPANRPGIAELARSREAAARHRGEWLTLIADGVSTIDQLFTEAAAPDGRPLLKLSLRQVLLAQPGWGRNRTRAVLEKILSVAGGRVGHVQSANVGHVQPTVSWLLDSRSGGRRVAALLDALEPKKGAPWPGFPFSPQAAN